jgi:hypothetical protein
MTAVTNGVSLGRQALRRDVNTRISGLGAESEAETVDVFCECGRSRCSDRIRIAMDAYEQVRTSAARFVVTAGHEEPGAALIARNNGYVVVERTARR